jgi:protein TonB
MGMVAGLHVAALYLIATSLGMVPPLVTESKPFILQPPEAAPPDDPPKPIVPRQRYEPVISLTEPVAPPLDPPASDTGLIAELRDDPPRAPTGAPAGEARLVGVRVDSRHPLSQPVYPSTDIRQGNEGTAEIEVYVLPDGRVGDARIVKSAGSPTLDQSAIDEARRRWRLLPATRDGQPYAQWHRLKVTFNLKNR